MALRIGYMGPVFEAPELARDYLMTLGSDGGPGPELVTERAGTGLGPFLCTINNQLRTGTDKGNLTV